MRLHLVCLLLIASGLVQQCVAQDRSAFPDDQSVPAVAGTTPAPVSATPPERDVSWKRLVPNILNDQKQIWLFPASVARGHHFKPVLAITAITLGLIAVDAHNAKYFQRTQSYAEFDKIFSGKNTALGSELFPLGFYAVGLIRKDSYAQRTFLLASEAVLDTAILTSVMKDADGRLTPAEFPPGSNFSDSWFRRTNRGAVGLIRGNGSFPSGHTIAAFSVATVFADRYPKPLWRPLLAYGLASVVGFSRLSVQSHFTSDVFAGAALGYIVTHYVVLRRRKGLFGGADSK